MTVRELIDLLKQQPETFEVELMLGGAHLAIVRLVPMTIIYEPDEHRVMIECQRQAR